MGLDMYDLGLVPGVKIPPKFKVPDFNKYKGTSCPRTHVKSYYKRMSAYSDDEKLLMHFFQDSLIGGPLEWYMKLDGTLIHTWREMDEDFFQHYRYNTDMAPTRTQLQNLSQKQNESLKSTLRGGVTPYFPNGKV